MFLARLPLPWEPRYETASLDSSFRNYGHATRAYVGSSGPLQ